MLKTAGLLLATTLLLTSVAAAQNNRWDVSLGATGALSKESSGNGSVLTPTNSLNFLATARYRFSPRIGLAFNYGRAKNSQKYVTPIANFNIHDSLTEYSGTLVVTPIEREKYEVFVLGGVGALRFYPDYLNYVNNIQLYLFTQNQTRFAFLYGAGVDYRVYKKIAVRLQYRGLVYSPPDFGLSTLFIPGKTHLAEPGVGLVLKF